jgi:hypothetical protein
LESCRKKKKRLAELQEVFRTGSENWQLREAKPKTRCYHQMTGDSWMPSFYNLPHLVGFQLRQE